MKLRWLAALTLAVTLVGCAPLTKPAETIATDRQAFVNAWARVKIAYWAAAAVAQRACGTGQWPPAECEKAARLHDQAKRIAAEIEAKIETPESEVDWQRVMKVLEIALDILL